MRDIWDRYNDTALNYLKNILWVVVGAACTSILRERLDVVDIYATAPFLAKWLIAIVSMVFAFIFITWLRLVALRNADKYPKVAPTVFYLFGYPFAFGDIQLNVNVMNYLFLEPANSHGEGWLLTDRLRHHIRFGENQMDKNLDPGWRYHEATYWCRIVDSIDRGHCRRRAS